MGLSQIISPFYRKLSDDEKKAQPVSGQVCRIPSIFLDPVPLVIEAHRLDDRDHAVADITIRNLKVSDYGRKDTLPIKKLNVAAGEELLAVKSKRRRAIILPPDTYISESVNKLLPSMGKKHLQERHTLLTLPMYSAQVDGFGSGFPQIMVARIKTLMYPQYFYLPPDNRHTQKECVLRFDRAQVIVSKDPAVLQLLEYVIVDEAFEMLLSHFMRWLKLPSDTAYYEAYKTVLELLETTLPDEISAE